MSEIFNILSHSIGSLFLGILITTTGTGLMFFIIKSWYKNRTYTPLSFIVGAILFFLLAYHAIIICGAVTIKGYGDDMELLINSYIKDVPSNTVFTKEDSQRVIEQLGTDLPLVWYYANLADFHGHTPATLAAAMNDTMQSYMNSYIIKHLLWAFFFILLGSFIVIKTMEGIKVGHRGARHSRTKFYDE